MNYLTLFILLSRAKYNHALRVHLPHTPPHITYSAFVHDVAHSQVSKAIVESNGVITQKLDGAVFKTSIASSQIPHVVDFLTTSGVETLVRSENSLEAFSNLAGVLVVLPLLIVLAMFARAATTGAWRNIASPMQSIEVIKEYPTNEC